MEPRVPSRSEVAAEVASINEAAKGMTKVIIVFLATALYLAVSIAGTDSQQLLLNGNVNFPILNTGVPCWLFYLLAPVLIVVLHANTLLEGYFLTQKVVYLQRQSRTQIPELSQSITVLSAAFSLGHRVPFYIKAIIPGLYLMTNALIPLSLLLFMQAKFLPFHGFWISRLHRSLVVFDLTLIILFFFYRGTGMARAHRLGIAPHQASRRPSPGNRLSRSRQLLGNLLARGYYWAVVVIFAAVVSWLSVFRIVVPETCAGDFDEWFMHHRLGRVHSLLSSLISTHINAEGKKFESGIKASGRDLRCADFRNADLSHSDFRGAMLKEAKFDHAVLVSANFGRTPEGLLDAHGLVPGSRTNLTGASFRDAELIGADLSYAQLNLAQFRNASLMDASFNGSKADEADFTEATGRVAFDSASLRGATLFTAELRLSSFARAHLEVANLVGADLRKADFSGATLVGADMRRALLQDAKGLSLEGVDLTRAHLEGLNFCSPSQDTKRHAVSSAQTSGGSTAISEPRNSLDYADLRDAYLHGSCIATVGRTLFYRQPELRGHTEKPAAERTREQPAEIPSEDQFHHALVYYLIDVRLRNELLPHLAKAVTRPSESSRFDVTVACAIMCERERRQQADQPDAQDPFLRLPDDLVRRLSAIAEDCSVLLAEPGAAASRRARASAFGPICN